MEKCKEIKIKHIRKFEQLINSKGLHHFSNGDGVVKAGYSSRSKNDTDGTMRVIDGLKLKKFIIDNNLKSLLFTVFGKDVILELNRNLRKRTDIILDD